MEADSQSILCPCFTECSAKADFLVCFDATASLCSRVRVENCRIVLPIYSFLQSAQGLTREDGKFLPREYLCLTFKEETIELVHEYTIV